MPYPFKKMDNFALDGKDAKKLGEARELAKLISENERLQEALLKIWDMLDETVADAISAYLDATLTALHIEHNIRETLGGNKKNEMG